MVDAFSKYTYLKAVKSTKIKYVIDLFKDIFTAYGMPENIIIDQGSSFTSKRMKEFMTHIKCCRHTTGEWTNRKVKSIDTKCVTYIHARRREMG